MTTPKEDGLEIFMPTETALADWNALLLMFPNLIEALSKNPQIDFNAKEGMAVLSRLQRALTPNEFQLK